MVEVVVVDVMVEGGFIVVLVADVRVEKLDDVVVVVVAILVISVAFADNLVVVVVEAVEVVVLDVVVEGVFLMVR